MQGLWQACQNHADDEHCDEDTHDELTTTLYRSTWSLLLLAIVMQAVQHYHACENAFSTFLCCSSDVRRRLCSTALRWSNWVHSWQWCTWILHHNRSYEHLLKTSLQWTAWYWRKHVQKVTLDSSDSFSVLTGSKNGERRFIEKVIRVQEMDSGAHRIAWSQRSQISLTSTDPCVWSAFRFIRYARRRILPSLALW